MIEQLRGVERSHYAGPNQLHNASDKSFVLFVDPLLSISDGYKWNSFFSAHIPPRTPRRVGGNLSQDCSFGYSSSHSLSPCPAQGLLWAHGAAGRGELPVVRPDGKARSHDATQGRPRQTADSKSVYPGNHSKSSAVGGVVSVLWPNP